MMWTEGFHVLLLDLLSSFTRPDGQNTTWHTFYQCLGTDLVFYYMNRLKCNDPVSDVAQKLPFHEKAGEVFFSVYIQAQFDFIFYNPQSASHKL